MGNIRNWYPQGAELLTQVENPQRGQGVTYTVFLWLWNRNPVFADSSPISFLHLSQEEKYCRNMKRKVRRNNVKTHPSQQFYSVLHLWCWEGKRSLFMHSWANYLSLFYKATGMIFEMEKPQNVLNDIDKHGYVWLPDFLLLFHCVFEVLRERE